MNTLHRTYFLTIGLLLFVGIFYVTHYIWWHTVLFIIGLVLGLVLMVGDEKIGWKYYQEVNQTTHLITRSLLFILAFIPLQVFVVTSTGSYVGVGMVLSIGLVLLTELWLVRHTPVLEQRFLWQLKRPLTVTDTNRLLYVFTGIYSVLTILSLM